MNDGHSGIGNQEINSGGSGGFQLKLSYLKQSDGTGEFVIHATTNYYTTYGLQPAKFLEIIGLRRFDGICQFHRDNCYFRAIASLPRGGDRLSDHQGVERIHAQFSEFSDKIQELYQLYNRQEELLRLIGERSPGKSIFAVAAVEILSNEGEPPAWVESEKFSQLRDFEKQRDTLQKSIDELSVYLERLPRRMSYYRQT